MDKDVRLTSRRTGEPLSYSYHRNHVAETRRELRGRRRVYKHLLQQLASDVQEDWPGPGELGACMYFVRQLEWELEVLVVARQQAHDAEMQVRIRQLRDRYIREGRLPREK